MEAKNGFERVVVKALNNSYLSRLFLLPYLPLAILPAPLSRYVGITASMSLGGFFLILGVYLTIRFDEKVNGAADDTTTITKLFLKHVSLPIILGSAMILLNRSIVFQ